MATPGRLLSLGLANRYSFEALGRGLHLDQLTGSAVRLGRLTNRRPGLSDHADVGETVDRADEERLLPRRLLFLRWAADTRKEALQGCLRPRRRRR
jgi:hypothetical protein